jgi:hypothetical protein
MTTRLFRAACAAAVGLALLTAAACGDDDDSDESSSESTTTTNGSASGSVAGAAEDLCDSLSTLDSTVEDIAGSEVDPETTTIADVQDGLEELRSEVSDVASSGSALASAAATALTGAFDRFEQAVEDLPEDDTVADGGASLEGLQQDFDEAWESAQDALDCNGS